MSSIKGWWKSISVVKTLLKHGHFICLEQVGAMEPLGYFDPAGFCKVGDKVRDPVEGGVPRVLDIRIAAVVGTYELQYLIIIESLIAR